ncbi:MAG: hypothetical protein J6S21_00595, partial [Victivallales bacterium]|nr:hypothetical protein [Victivallales bacterium]
MDWRIYFTGSEELSAACGLAEGLWDCWCHGGLPGKGFPDGGCEVSGDVNDLDTIREVKTLPMECAVAVTVINSPSERDIIIGAGCDWWFEARLNGVCIHSTMESGNVFMDDDIGITNHAVRGRLNAGSNLLLMILRRGNGFSWRFAAAELPPMPAGMTPDDFERLYGKRGRRILCGPYLQAKAGGRLAVCVHLDRPLTAALQWREKG